jgi:glycosyltransferase involved in cell wall biosynthesis
MLAAAKGAIEIRPRVPEAELAAAYAQADVFIFTTIQDGFAAVLLQAATAGLPVLATKNCSAPDFVVEGETGWTVAIRDSDAFIQRLLWCDANRPALARMALASGGGDHGRDWSQMARDFVRHYASQRPTGIRA